MFRRLLRQVGFALSAWLVVVPGIAVALPSQAPRPPAPQRIVAIGDLHGDCSAWRDIARAAQLIDAGNRWIGGKTVLVQDGDVPDRGPDSLLIIRDLQRLKREALRAGGRVVTMVGNHEAMNVTDDLRYVHPGEYAAFVDRDSVKRRASFYDANRAIFEASARKTNPALSRDQIRDAWLKATPLGMLEHQAAWHPTGEIGKWVIGNPAVALIGDTVFVHGGISAAYSAIPIDEINRRVAAALAAREMNPESIINDSAGPLWYRGLITRAKGVDEGPAPTGSAIATAPRPSIEAEIDMALKAYGAKRMVVAHTPILSGITVTHDGKLIRIDTGISKYYGGALSYLEILGDQIVPHTVSRTSTRCTK
ncbi:MAG TPA: metallophosphoesterase [Sphingomicrobium sp.]|nr:metallophosphoesterase [Sphingomicrobium sp.]